jgi:hypothetical protein
VFNSDSANAQRVPQKSKGKKVNLEYLVEARRNIDESGTRTHATYVTRKLTIGFEPNR